MKSLDKVRSTSQKKQGQEMKSTPHRSLQEGEQKSAQPETVIVMKGFTEAARNSLRSLSKLELRLLELSYYEGQSQSDLARMLRIPLGTIKGKMRRGIQKLRQVLAEEAA
jgi:RNA polymerase sigma-70 factor (ECF subfamily)